MHQIGVRGQGLGVRNSTAAGNACRAIAARRSASSAVHRRRARRGISLLEVLISMFVLAVGLLSVAALIPAGRYEIAQSTQLDNTAMIGRAAFRDLQVRGFLSPGDTTGTSNWRNPSGVAVWVPSTPMQPFRLGGASSARVAFALDPLGAVAGYGATFPALAPTLSLTRIAPLNVTATGARQLVDSVFRSSVDLATVDNRGEPFTDSNRNGQYDNGVDSFDAPTQDGNANGVHDGPNSNLPPQQSWFRDSSNPNLLTNVLRRASQGDYSWLATIVSDPTQSALDSKVTVSVAVFHKRNLGSPGAGERVVEVGTLFVGIGGGTFKLKNLPLNFVAVKPGTWIMLAGRESGGEPFTDSNENGQWDTTEQYDDRNGNGSYDPGPPHEPYSDINGNGQWEDPEPYTDLNRNGVYDSALNLDYFAWYRVASAARVQGGQQLIDLSGPDWPRTINVNLQAFLFDNIIAVYEKNLSLKIE
jgi:type II secretory pathway pseudopilin PulG